MFEATQISSEKVAAYLRTTYHLDFPSNPIHLKVGEFSIELENIFRSKHIHCAAFITAYNPQGTQVSNQKNIESHTKLLNEIQKLSLEFIEGSGYEEGTDWPSEKSLFILDLSLDQTRRIGSLFEQDAVVWVGDTLVPELILLR